MKRHFFLVWAKNAPNREFLTSLFSDPAEECRNYLFSKPNRETISRSKQAEIANPLSHTMVEDVRDDLARQVHFTRSHLAKLVAAL